MAALDPGEASDPGSEPRGTGQQHHAAESGSAPTRLGVIGVGTIAAAMVEAILTGPHGPDIEVVLSPRSADRAADLARRHAAVRIADSNQGVLDASDTVVFAVLPDQVADVCAGLSFRADHVVASVVAGWPPSALTPRVRPAVAVCQLIPLPMIALRTGPIPIHPDLPAVTALLEGCGQVVVLEHESDLIVLNCVSATMSTYFQFQTTLVDWATASGMPRDAAAQYVTALLSGLAAEATVVGPGGLDVLAAAHETPGGLNEQVRRCLTDAGLFDELTRQLDHLHRTRQANG